MGQRGVDTLCEIHAVCCWDSTSCRTHHSTFYRVVNPVMLSNGKRDGGATSEREHDTLAAPQALRGGESERGGKREIRKQEDYGPKTA